jgi:hypothetical protein
MTLSVLSCLKTTSAQLTAQKQTLGFYTVRGI